MVFSNVRFCQFIASILIINTVFGNRNLNLNLTQSDIDDLDKNNNFTKCGERYCLVAESVCASETKSECGCNLTMATFPIDSAIQCTYYRKKQIIAFFLELCVTYGSGHIYVGNYQIGIPKLIFWIIGYCLFIILRAVNKSREENNTTTLTIAIFGCVFCCIMLIWEIFDVFMFALNKYTDGNSIELIPFI